MKSRINVLLLEDELRIGELYVRGFGNEAFKVTWAKTTTEVEDFAKKGSFNVILLDHGIKGEGRSGMDLIPMLRKVLPESKIVVLSNYNLFQLEEKRDDTIHYLLKIDTPPSILVKKVHQILAE